MVVLTTLVGYEIILIFLAPIITTCIIVIGRNMFVSEASIQFYLV
ncbi:Uncharacterised protein [Segatella copri]|nr:Uncharacterised protein [Segatella copri]